jgi:hypothetical protein
MLFSPKNSYGIAHSIGILEEFLGTIPFTSNIWYVDVPKHYAINTELTIHALGGLNMHLLSVDWNCLIFFSLKIQGD